MGDTMSTRQSMATSGGTREHSKNVRANASRPIRTRYVHAPGSADQMLARPMDESSPGTWTSVAARTPAPMAAALVVMAATRYAMLLPANSSIRFGVAIMLMHMLRPLNSVPNTSTPITMSTT